MFKIHRKKGNASDESAIIRYFYIFGFKILKFKFNSELKGNNFSIIYN